MPHTSRKKKATAQKRLEIADDDGWTHVTKGGNVPRRAVKTAEGELLPAEPPSRLTIGELKKQYEAHRQKWDESSTNETLNHVLRERLSQSMKNIDNIVCIGLGSPSGFLRGGWVDRRSVSLYQLAALAAIAGLFGMSSVSLQSPCYSDSNLPQKLLIHSLLLCKSLPKTPSSMTLIRSSCSPLELPWSKTRKLSSWLTRAPFYTVLEPRELIWTVYLHQIPLFYSEGPLTISLRSKKS